MKRSLLLWGVLLLVLALSACGGKEQAKQPTIPIVVADTVPNADVGVAYDLSDVVTQEADVEYSYTASYTDPETGETVELKVRRGKFTPKAEADISVTVTATQGKNSSSVDFVVPVNISADIMDQLLSSQGIAGQADAGVTKTVTKDIQFVHGERSTSALSVNFSNPTAGGAALLNLSHYALPAYYTAQVWRNAAVSFWVYNPMNQDVSFKLASRHPETEMELLWDSPENTQLQVAKAGQWTQIAFSLYDMGIVKPVVDSETHTGTPSLRVLARYAGSESCAIYVDGVDIVHANTVEGLTTGYVDPVVPEGDFSDLLKTCKVYSGDPATSLTKTDKGNGSGDAYCFGAKEPTGYPTLYVDLPQVTDISGFDYLKFDVLAENSYPWVSVAIRYLDENGQEQKHGTTYDFVREQWRTIYLNLDYLHYADLSRVVGFSISIHMDSKFVPNIFNCLYFDNMSLYTYPMDEPEMAPATLEDKDLISGPFFTSNGKGNTSGVCKVATDETGESKSNSMLMFWANNACGYPNVYATFMFDQEQDWSDYSVLTFDTHQDSGHYWMRFDVICLDEEGKEKTLVWYNDTIFNHWMPTNAPLNWFETQEGEAPQKQDWQRVVGLRIYVDLAVHVTDEVAKLYFDNLMLS